MRASDAFYCFVVCCFVVGCCSTITLNGHQWKVANMFRTFRFDVTGLVKATGNTLTVVFQSPNTYAAQSSCARGVLFLHPRALAYSQ
jgi:beta-galactosidase/beta-glucuronidase